MDTKIYFSRNLYSLRRKHGLSQSALGEILNVEPQTISKWERGINEPGFQMLLKLSEHFKITLDDFLATEIKGEDTVMKQVFNIKTTDDIDSKLFMFPRINANESVAVGMFKRAYELDCNNNGTNVDAHLEMVHLYWDAFDRGIMDAGVNLLRILAMHNVLTKEDKMKFPFQEKMEHIIHILKSAGHPAGEYYEALALVYGFLDTQMSEEDSLDEGITMMDTLVNEGNEYAIAWVEKIEASEG